MLALTTLGFSNTYDLSFTWYASGGHTNLIDMNATSILETPTVCTLATSHYEVTKAPGNNAEVGTININFATDTSVPCFSGPGRETAKTSFHFGKVAPALLGKYDLTINGEYYGELTVSEGSTQLVRK